MIRRSTLRAQLATALTEEILAGRMPTGRDFTVKAIAEQYGVSATPVREALADLAAQGLVDIEAHRGFRVHEFTPDDFRSMIEARTMIMEGVFRHPGACERLVQELGPAALTSVRRRAVAAERAALAGDLDVLIGYDLRYWRELGCVLRNAYVQQFLERLRVQCWAFTVPRLRRAREPATGLWAGHGELLDAVERRDTSTAERIVTAYNEHALALLGRLDDLTDPTDPTDPIGSTGSTGSGTA